MLFLKKLLNFNQKISSNDGDVRRFRLGTKIVFFANIVLVLSISIAAVITYQYERFALEEQIFTKSRSVAISLQVIHTQSMLHRVDKGDENSVIATMNAVIENVSKFQKGMRAWLFMGPKVSAYQHQMGGKENELPLDGVSLKFAKSESLIESN